MCRKINKKRTCKERQKETYSMDRNKYDVAYYECKFFINIRYNIHMAKCKTIMVTFLPLLGYNLFFYFYYKW